MKQLTRKMSGFCAGTFLNALGISLVTKASLGTSPISSLAYVLSLGFTPSFGFFTFLFNMVFLVGQILLLKKKFEKYQLLQIPVTICFGLLIDLNMYLLKDVYPAHYVSKLLILFGGCCVMALGITLAMRADFLMTPGDAFVRAAAGITGYPFGNLKTCFDCGVIASACICSMLLFRGIRGVREGTLISALLVGNIVNFYQKCFSRMEVCK